ncbi:MAG: aldo/keto reductase [Chloroflexi bacterium]|nr:aldo/keto reductase [Chloroflexota bacterium]
MKYRRLGNAGIKLSVLGLGGWTTFGESIKDAKLARQIITTAYDLGINFYDIADAYARGEAERQMGAILADYPRHTLVISSKLYWPMSDDPNDRGLSRKHIRESIDKSLKRIGTDYLDIYYCHRYDTETPLEETVRAMSDLVHQGKVLYWGTSEWSGEQIAQAVALAREHNLYGPSVEQPQYNLLVRERVEKEILPVVEPNGIGLTTFSPLATGILTGKYDNGLPEGSRLAREGGLRERWYNEATVAKVKRLEPLAKEAGLSRSQLALAWLLKKAGVSSVITGATKPEQVRENVAAVETELSDDLVKRIEETIA